MYNMMTAEQRKKFRDIRKSLDSFITKIADSTQEVNENVNVIRAWKPAVYFVGDVRQYAGIPYKCIQAHDAIENPHWTPEIAPSLWAQYHGTSFETAREWVQPFGSHDMYKVGEYMIYEDVIYRCELDTIYSPDEYTSAWSIVE